MADDSVWFRLFSVNVRQAKFELTTRALAARHALQRWVMEQWHASNAAQIARWAWTNAGTCCLHEVSADCMTG
jgi:hypothetical protein